MALIFGLWWIYFDFVSRRRPRPGIRWTFVWTYLHLPLVMSIAALSAGAVNLLTKYPAFAHQSIIWLVGWTLGAAIIIIGLLELTLRRDAYEPTDPTPSVGLKIGAGVIALSSAWWGAYLPVSGFLLCLLMLLLIPMVYGAIVWFTRPEGEPAQLVPEPAQ